MDVIEILGKVFDGAVRAMPLPNILEEGIIGVKNVLTNDNTRDKILDVFSNLFNKNGNIVKDIWNVKDVIKEKGVQAGVSKAIDLIINNAKTNKNISKEMAQTLKDSKNIIIENIINKKEKGFEGQEKILNSIDKKYDKWENFIKENQLDKANKLGNEIKKEYTQLFPTLDLIQKVNSIDNFSQLYHNKLSSVDNEISNLEKEILQKIA